MEVSVKGGTAGIHVLALFKEDCSKDHVTDFLGAIEIYSEARGKQEALSPRARRRNGMTREFIKELRGDSRGEAIDIYDHIDPSELRKAYLAAIPRLGIT